MAENNPELNIEPNLDIREGRKVVQSIDSKKFIFQKENQYADSNWGSPHKETFSNKNYYVKMEGDWIRNGATGFSEEITSEKINKEYFNLVFLKEMGLNIPDVVLFKKGNKTALATEQIQGLRGVNMTEFISDPSNNKLLQKVFYTSIVIDDLNIIEHLRSDGEKIIFTNAYKFDKGSTHAYWYEEFKREKLPFLNKIETDDDIKNAITNLTPEKMLNIIQSLNIKNEEVMNLISSYCRNRELALKDFEKINPDEALNNSSDWDVYDSIIEKSEGHRLFNNIDVDVEEFNELATKIIGLEEGGNFIVDLPELKIKPDDLIRDIGSTIITSRSNEEFLETISKYRQMEKKADILNKNMSKFNRFFGGENKNKEIKNKLDNFKKDILQKFNNYVDFWLEVKYKELNPWELHGNTPLMQLNKLYAPTNKQLVNLINSYRKLQILSNKEIIKLKSDKLQHFEILINYLKKDRVAYKKLCEERTKSIVTHLTLPKIAKQILISGKIMSSQRQKDELGQANINSGWGRSAGLLPEVHFTINGVEGIYGGSDKEMEKWGDINMYAGPEPGYGVRNTHLSVGFVGLYSSVVEGKNVAEMHGFGKELHIFDNNYTIHKREGSEVEIDDKLAFFVPEAQSNKWKEFLLTSKEEGGAGKDTQWIKKYFRIYPEYLDLHTYVRYFAKPEDFNYSGTINRGFLLRTNQELEENKQRFGKAYIWVQV